MGSGPNIMFTCICQAAVRMVNGLGVFEEEDPVRGINVDEVEKERGDLRDPFMAALVTRCFIECTLGNGSQTVRPGEFLEDQAETWRRLFSTPSHIRSPTTFLTEIRWLEGDRH